MNAKDRKFGVRISLSCRISVARHLSKGRITNNFLMSSSPIPDGKESIEFIIKENSNVIAIDLHQEDELGLQPPQVMCYL